MNIFWLSLDPKQLAAFYSDTHCVKIILEIAQMLYTARRSCGEIDIAPPGKTAYRSSHKNHPMTRFVASSPQAWKKTCEIGLALCREYTLRFNKVHACECHILLLQENPPQHWRMEAVSPPKNKKSRQTRFGKFGTLSVPLCMPPKYHDDCAVTAYRNYYKTEKRGPTQRWGRIRKAPEWYTNVTL